MTNKELQKLFQDKLGGRKVDFDPSAWERMQITLDSKMPIKPWYISFSYWIKGMTAAMVTAFSFYFLAYNPIGNLSPEVDVNENVVETQTSNQLDNLTTQTSVPSSTATSNNLNTQGTESNSNNASNVVDNDAIAYNSTKSDRKAAKAKRKATRKNNYPIVERFYDEPAEEINQKEADRFTLVAEEDSYVVVNNPDNDTPPSSLASNNKKKNASVKTRVGFAFEAISAKNLMPQSEGTINTGYKPAFAVGFTVLQPIHNNIGLTSGLYYKYQKAEGQSVTTYTDYSFGLEQSILTLDYKSLHSIELPLQLYYRLGLKHQVNFGAFASYYLAVRSAYTQETRDAFSSTKETGNNTSNKALADQLDYGLSFGYSYWLNNQWQIGLEASTGLKELQLEKAYDLKEKSGQFLFKLNYWF